MKWTKKELSECCISIADGDHQPPPKADAGIPFVTISNIRNNSIDFKNCMHVPQAYYDSLHEKRKAQKDDILYSVVGSFGIPVLIRENKKFVFQRHIAILRPDKSVISPVFMYYAMLNRDFYLQADAAAIGAAQRTISLGSLQKLVIPLPDMLTQKHIASILSAYDDLIENNRRQIKLLEEAAQRLYREWFVELRFPGHEGVKIVDGVPEGWKRERLVNIADVQYGYAFDGSLFNVDGNGMPIIRIRNIPNAKTSDYTTEEANEQYLVHNGDIVVGMDGEFHINSWAGETAYLVQRTCRIKPYNKNMNGYLLWAIHDPIKFFEKTVVGATVAHLGKKHIDTISLLIPPAKYYMYFNKIFQKRLLLMNQNVLLAEARDRLLPKLMNIETEAYP